MKLPSQMHAFIENSSCLHSGDISFMALLLTVHFITDAYRQQYDCTMTITRHYANLPDT